MSDTVAGSVFREAFLEILDETFDNHHGWYLDRGDALFVTLGGVSAEEASKKVGPTCSTIAAQVAHLIYYIDLGLAVAAGNPPEKVDWSLAWQTSTVTEGEWQSLIDQLRDRQQQWVAVVKATETLDLHMINGAFAMTAHTAYHLGEIRQALCALRQ